MKFLVKLVVILLFVIAIAAIAAPYFISSETVKTQLTAHIKEHTGKTLAIEGDFSLRFFPDIAAYAEGISLTDEKGKTMLKAKALDVGVTIASLLERKIDIARLAVIEPEIFVDIARDGSHNWQFGKHVGDLSPSAGKSTASDNDIAQTPLSIDDLSVENARIVYKNAKAGINTVIEQASLHASLSGQEQAASLDGNLHYEKQRFDVEGKLASLVALQEGKESPFALKLQSALANLSLNGNVTKESYSGTFAMDSASLKNALSWFSGKKPLSVNTPMVLDVRSDMRCSAQECLLTNVDLRLDDIHLSGGSGIRSIFKGANKGTHVGLTADIIDLNPYLSDDEKQASLSSFLIADAMAEDASYWDNTPIDMGALRDFNGSLVLDMAGLKIKKITMGKTHLDAKAHNGVVKMSVQDAEFYNGKATVDAVINTVVTPMQLTKKVELMGIDMGAYLRDAADYTKLSGKGNLLVNVSGQGQSERQIVSSLRGAGRFVVAEGELKGVNLLDMIGNIQSAFNPDASSDRTVFTQCEGSFTIENGVLHNRDLILQTNKLRTSGEGKVDIVRRWIDYRLTPNVSLAVKDKNGEYKEGMRVPVLVSGPLDNPKFKPDLASLATQALKDPETAKQQVKGLKEIFKKVNSKDDLKNLLGKPKEAAPAPDSAPVPAPADATAPAQP